MRRFFDKGAVAAATAGAALAAMILVTGRANSPLLLPSVALPALIALVSVIGAWSLRDYARRGAVSAVTFTLVVVIGLGEPATGVIGFIVVQWLFLALTIVPAMLFLPRLGRAAAAPAHGGDSRADRRRRARDVRESRPPATRRPS
ncbi:MAG: hypothetical protein ACKVVT_14020 [Dehalococcoidia bacterium]